MDEAQIEAIMDKVFTQMDQRLDAKLAPLYDKIDRISGRLDTLKSSFDVLNGSVKSLQGDIVKMQSDLSEMKGDVSKIQDSLSKLQQDVAHLDKFTVKRFESVDDGIARVEKSLKSLREESESMEMRLENRIASLDRSTDQRLVSLTHGMSTQFQTTDLDKLVKRFVKRLNTINARISELKARVGTTDSKVQALEANEMYVNTPYH